MKEILDFDEVKTKPLRAKNEKFAFITLLILILLILILIKFLYYIQTALLIDSPLIPSYAIFYANRDSFISGAFITALLIISLIFFYQKKFTASFLLNCFLIIFNLGFSYLYYNYLN